MGLLLTASQLYVPQFLRKRKLAMLFAATADAFRQHPPSISGLSADDSLKLYAQFTREQAGNIIRQGNPEEVRSRLFENACRIGRDLRDDFHIRTVEEVMRMSAVVYKILKIDFHGESRGRIVISHCFFSDYYPSDVCSLVSSLDAGLLAGLSGGGRLSFSQRITEGKACCLAHLDTAEGLI